MTRNGLTRDTSVSIRVFVATPCDSEAVTAPPRCRPTPWGCPVAEHDAGWVILDVETTGFRPGQARIISIAALALDPDGAVERSVVSLLNPGVDPGPTHVHGLTAEMLAEQPSFADIVAGSGESSGSRVTAYDGAQTRPDGTPPAKLDFDVFPGFNYGVFVG